MTDIVLKINLHEAKNLPASDPTVMGGKSDPYIIFQVGKTQLKSSRIIQDLNPIWCPPEEFAFHLMMKDLPSTCLNVFAKDWDRFNKDDSLGRCSIPLSQFIPSEDDEKKSYCCYYPLEIHESLQTSNQMTAQIGLTIELVSTKEYYSMQPLEIWENERWIPGRGYHSDHLMVSDRYKWSTRDGKESSEHFSQVAPQPKNGWKTMDGWGYSVEQGDNEGWLYAITFSGPWQKKNSPMMNVRRRKWMAHYYDPDSKQYKELMMKN